MTDDQVTAMLAALTEHFRCPVMPIDRYCAGLRAWQRCLQEKAQRTKAKEDVEFAGCVDDVFRQITKSNLLARVLYGGEAPRVEPCPTHKGVWSGCVFGDRECPHCMSGCNVTGWVKP